MASDPSASVVEPPDGSNVFMASDSAASRVEPPAPVIITMASAPSASSVEPLDHSTASLSVRKLNVKYKWKHLPQRSDRGQHRRLPIAPRPPSLTVLSRRATAEGLHLQRAAAPALPSDPLPSLEIRENASRAHSAVEDLNVDVLAARLAASALLQILRQ